MSSTRWRVRAVALAVLASAVGTACNPTTPLTQGPRLAKDQTLHVLLDDQPATLDPGQTQYPYETAVLRTISEPLLKPTADLNGVTPAAAQTYDVNNNGTVYTFHLRTTAQYWDGIPVKAQDFVYAWQRLIDPRLAAPSGPFFAASILNGDQVSALDPQRDASQIPAALGTLGVKAVDAFTLQVTLSHPNPAFVWIAAMPAGGPIRQDVVAKYADKWASSPDSLVTNGPFRITEMVPNVHLTVVPNPHYWGAKPRLTAITFDVVNDGAVALARYKNGELDEIDVQPAQAAEVAGSAQLNPDLVKTPALSVFWIVFRIDQAPVSNVKVRQAIAAAIDRDALIAQIFAGQGLPAQTFIPKGMRGYAPDLGSSQQFDVARARATFAASGVTAKDMSAVKFTYDQSSDFSKATAKFVHDQLKTNLGVDITLEAIDTNTLSSRLDTGDFQISGPLGWMADYPDPADWFGIFLTTNSNNFAFYQNKQYDSFVRTAGSDVQSDRRAQEYKQAQSLLVNDVPAAFLAQPVTWNLVRPYVRGMTTSSVDEWPGALFPAQIYIAAH
ncbi:MAG TPA: peptide ABC transporter substrate-binding protein [Candidatus Dormibacteraeota bacterium]